MAETTTCAEMKDSTKNKQPKCTGLGWVVNVCIILVFVVVAAVNIFF